MPGSGLISIPSSACPSRKPSNANSIAPSIAPHYYTSDEGNSRGKANLTILSAIQRLGQREAIVLDREGGSDSDMNSDDYGSSEYDPFTDSESALDESEAPQVRPSFRRPSNISSGFGDLISRVNVSYDIDKITPGPSKMLSAFDVNIRGSIQDDLPEEGEPEIESPPPINNDGGRLSVSSIAQNTGFFRRVSVGASALFQGGSRNGSMSSVGGGFPFMFGRNNSTAKVDISPIEATSNTNMVLEEEKKSDMIEEMEETKAVIVEKPVPLSQTLKMLQARKQAEAAAQASMQRRGTVQPDQLDDGNDLLLKKGTSLPFLAGNEEEEEEEDNIIDENEEIEQEQETSDDVQETQDASSDEDDVVGYVNPFTGVEERRETDSHVLSKIPTLAAENIKKHSYQQPSIIIPDFDDTNTTDSDDELFNSLQPHPDTIIYIGGQALSPTRQPSLAISNQQKDLRVSQSFIIPQEASSPIIEEILSKSILVLNNKSEHEDTSLASDQRRPMSSKPRGVKSPIVIPNMPNTISQNIKRSASTQENIPILTPMGGLFSERSSIAHSAVYSGVYSGENSSEDIRSDAHNSHHHKHHHENQEDDEGSETDSQHRKHHHKHHHKHHKEEEDDEDDEKKGVIGLATKYFKALTPLITVGTSQTPTSSNPHVHDLNVAPTPTPSPIPLQPSLPPTQNQPPPSKKTMESVAFTLKSRLNQGEVVTNGTGAVTIGMAGIGRLFGLKKLAKGIKDRKLVKREMNARMECEIPRNLYFDLVEDVIPMIKEFKNAYVQQLGEKHSFTMGCEAHIVKLETKLKNNEISADVDMTEEQEEAAANAMVSNLQRSMSSEFDVSPRRSSDKKVETSSFPFMETPLSMKRAPSLKRAVSTKREEAAKSLIDTMSRSLSKLVPSNEMSDKAMHTMFGVDRTPRDRTVDIESE